MAKERLDGFDWHTERLGGHTWLTECYSRQWAPQGPSQRQPVLEASSQALLVSRSPWQQSQGVTDLQQLPGPPYGLEVQPDRSPPSAHVEDQPSPDLAVQDLRRDEQPILGEGLRGQDSRCGWRGHR